ncbi:MAG: DUF86 domain-containing protein [Candidatus Hydrogenedentes bacterium]|nr:DUF86 domain-containing protein [Candidatus Hydrogenedentota bacterium]
MTSLRVIENKIASVHKYIKLLEIYKDRSQTEIENDPTLRGAVERYLYLAAQASIDLAEATIAYKHYRKPATNRECFEILVENALIERNLADRLIRMCAFRNMLAHAYDRIDYGVVVDALNGSLPDLDEFTNAIKQVN